jgi:outer membrane protein
MCALSAAAFFWPARCFASPPIAPAITGKRMAKVLFAACLAGGLAVSGMASAQTAATDPDAPVGKAANTIMIRLRGIGVLPQDSSSSISTIGGDVNASNSAAPEVDFSYFFTDHIAAELIAATTRHEISASNTSLGRVDVGSVWVLPPTVTLQYHFMPHERFSPYVGAGLNATFFYDAHPAGGAVTSLGFSDNVGAAIQAGFDYNFIGHWFANFDVKQIFVNTDASLNNGAIHAKTALNPTVIGAGIGYRF